MDITFKYSGLSAARLFVLLMLLVCIGEFVQAQDTGRPDSLQQRERQREQMGPPGQQQGATASQPEQEGQVNFSARDSLTFVFGKERIATLFGSSSVVHSSGQLQAGKISMNLDQHLVSANTQTPGDTLSQPVLTRGGASPSGQGGQSMGGGPPTGRSTQGNTGGSLSGQSGGGQGNVNRVRSNKIDYNYQTEKGRFEVARTQIQDGNVIGTRVKRTSPHVIFLEDAIYSTCQLDHPHYYIKAKRMKVVDEEKIFFEQARLFILDIPYPIVFPFGYVPGKFDQKQSGLLEPTYAYQQKSTRGYGLQNIGWFQYFNDYLTGQASFDIFTSGTYFVDARTNYRVRDDLNGNIQLGYSHENSGLESTDPDFSTNVQKRLSVSHSQDFSPYASFNTSINLRTADYFERNSYDPTERAETSTSSNLSYRYRHPSNIYNFSISARQNQNFRTNVTRLSGPNMNFSLKQFSPFANEQTTGQESNWYENISLRYENSFESDYEFDPIRQDTAAIGWFEALMSPTKYRQATGSERHYRYGFEQDVSMSISQILPSRFLNASINNNFTEYWFPTTIRKEFLPDSNEVVTRQVRGFTTARDFNTGINFSTTLYGITNLKIGKFESFRHTLRPNISFNYRPDFSTDYWGFYRSVQTDTTAGPDGQVPTERYSIFEDEVFSGPGRGEQQTLSFGLSNVFEAKQVRRDSTGEKQENTIRLIDRLDLNSSYNFAADSLKLADLSTSFSAGILPGMDIRANAQFNFYERDDNGRKIDHYLLTSSGRLFEMTSFSASTSYSFEWGDRGLQARNNNQVNYPQHYDPLNQRIFRPVDPHFNNRRVQSFDSPFSFSMNFSYRWNLNPTGENNKSATLNANNITMRLTPKWNFRTQIGYDFVEKELTPSQFSLTRNLHCWDLSFTMNPFGDNQYYFFSLRVNAGRLQSIFQKLPVLNNLERGTSQTGRGAPRGF